MNRFSKFKFGKYKGYDLGTIYLFDQSYIEWCIQNVDGFYIEDMDILLSYNVIQLCSTWSQKMENIYMTNPIIDYFSDFQEFIEHVELTENYIMDQDYIDTNNFKLRSQSNKKNTDFRRNSREEKNIQPDDNTIGLMEEAGDQYFSEEEEHFGFE